LISFENLKYKSPIESEPITPNPKRNRWKMRNKPIKRLNIRKGWKVVKRM
jgi:hypothetical protein